MASQLTAVLSNYIVRIRRYLKEETAATSQWSDEFVKQVFNSKYRLRATELFMTHEGFFTILGKRDLTADQSRYAWPTGFSRLLKLELIRTDGSQVPIQRQERHYGMLATSSAGGDEYLPTYRPVGSGFVLEPAPAASVTNGIYLEWNGLPEELTADGDKLHSDFPIEYDELLVLDAAITCFDSEGMQETGQQRSLLRNRAEWEVHWQRYIDTRMTSLDKVTPFTPHYADA